uniref:Uncharacterized protein n=1 Tax=Anguilla anguilla TaxID=7936 RepID=A0A0E9T9D5_ANGAN
MRNVQLKSLTRHPVVCLHAVSFIRIKCIFYSRNTIL